MIAILLTRAHHFQLLTASRLLPHIQPQVRSVKKSVKDKLDYSKYPEIREADLEEKFVFGSGPGGQHVNKRANCVQLLHIPTGVRVKCHEQRVKEQNQKIARALLREKVDAFLNGEDSIACQIKRIADAQNKKNDARAAKKRELKKQFKQSLLTESAAAADTTASPVAVSES